MDDVRYNIRELVRESDVPRRTIRYYVQRDLLPPPHGAGRGHYYTADHLERLRRIRQLQEQGRSLDEIALLLTRPDDRLTASLAAPPATLREAAAPPVDQPEPVAEPDPSALELYRRLPIAPGVDLQLSASVPLPPPERLRALAAAVRRILDSEGEKPDAAPPPHDD